MGRALLTILLLIILVSPALSKVMSLKVQDFTYRRYEGSELVLKLKSAYFEKREDESFSAKDLELFSPKRGIAIKAKHGFYNKNKDLFHFQGNVELKTDKHGDIYTEELFYDIKEEVLRAPARVIIKKDKISAEGSDLYYNLKSGEFRLKGSVRAKFSL